MTPANKNLSAIENKEKNEGLQDLQAKGEKGSFKIYEKEIKKISEFTYLVRILTCDNDDTRAIGNEISRGRTKWNSMVSILKQGRANPVLMATFYKTVVQAVFLYGAELWVVTKTNIKNLRAFHYRAFQCMMGCHIPKRGRRYVGMPKSCTTAGEV